MSDQFTFSLSYLRNSSSAITFERGSFTWNAGVLCATDRQTSLTLSCQPTHNKETILWRCNANVEIFDFMWKRPPKQWSVLFNSHMKCSESKTELGQITTDAVKLNVKVVSSFIIDLSSPTNALISMPSDAARFEIAGRVVYLSKNMLTRCSPFFDAMFNRDFLEKSTDSYALRDVDFLEVMHLMAIVHRKTAFMDASSVGYLATLADMYDVREVAQLSEEMLSVYTDQEVANREVLLERFRSFHQEKIIETKKVKIASSKPGERPGDHDFEIGDFRCRLNLWRYPEENGENLDQLLVEFFPLKEDRSVLWRCVTRSSAQADADVVGNDVVEEEKFSFYNDRYSSMRSASTGNQNYNFCMKLIESDFIDLSSPENEFIKDPEDAVCLQVAGTKLWFSKQVLTLSCASFCDLFKEAKDFYVIDDLNCTQFHPFIYFMAILHSHKFLGRTCRVACLLKMADRFRCGYMTDRVGYPGCG